MNTNIPEKAIQAKAEFKARCNFSDPQKQWDYICAFKDGVMFATLYLDIKDLREQDGKSMKGVRL